VKVRWTFVQSKTIVGGLITDSRTSQRQSYSWVAAVHLRLCHIPTSRKRRRCLRPEAALALCLMQTKIDATFNDETSVALPISMRR